MVTINDRGQEKAPEDCRSPNLSETVRASERACARGKSRRFLLRFIRDRLSLVAENGIDDINRDCEPAQTEAENLAVIERFVKDQQGDQELPGGSYILQKAHRGKFQAPHCCSKHQQWNGSDNPRQSEQPKIP